MKIIEALTKLVIVCALGFLVLQYTIPNLGTLPQRIVDNAEHAIVSRFGNEIFRIRFLGLITTNPYVHYRASELKQDAGDIKGAAEEMELALGLMSMSDSDPEAKQVYKARLAQLKK